MSQFEKRNEIVPSLAIFRHDPPVHIAGLEQKDTVNRQVDQLPEERVHGQLSSPRQAEDNCQTW